MYFLENEPDTMAPFLRGLIRRFVNRGGSSDPSLDRGLLGPSRDTSSELQSKSSGLDEKSEEKLTRTHSEVLEKLRTEAFQGL